MENRLEVTKKHESTKMLKRIGIIELGFVNAYLVAGKEGFVLIDAGLPQQYEKINNELKAAGCEPGKLRLIVMTRGDWDHAGNASGLREEYNTRLAVHSGDVNRDCFG